MADKPAINRGKELLGWEIAEYHEHSRGKFWFVLFAIVGFVLIIYALRERNFLFAFIIIMVAVILITHSLRSPARLRFSIYEFGIGLGARFYPWKDTECFWIAYEPPEVKNIYFEFSGLRPRLPIPLQDIDPNAVRKTLKEFIEEDVAKTEEPISDWLARVLKI